MPDLKVRELAVALPLIALLIFLGVFPKPLTEVVNPAVAAHHVRRTEEGPPARGGGRQVSATAVHSLWTTAGGVTSAAPGDRFTAPNIEYAQLAPVLIVVGAAVLGDPGGGVRPAPVPLHRPGVPGGRRPGRRVRRGGRPRRRRVRHEERAHRRDGRHRRRRPGPVPPGHHPAGLDGLRLHVRRAPPGPGVARQPGGLLRRAGRFGARAARARRRPSRPASPRPRSSRWCSSPWRACWSSRRPTTC